MNTKLTAKAYIQIQKSPESVFEAIINPREMQNYFASGSDTLTSGQTVEWWFPEFPDRFPVSVKDVVPYSHISFDWSGGKEGMLVEINLEARKDGSTVVRVEKNMRWISAPKACMRLSNRRVAGLISSPVSRPGWNMAFNSGKVLSIF